MTTENDPEDSSSFLNQLDPDYLSRLYPGGWDLSEHCADQPAAQLVEAAPEQAAPAQAAETPAAYYGPAPRSLQFLRSLYFSECRFSPF